MIENFLKLNKQILLKHKSKKFIGFCNRERPETAIEGSIIISAIANKKKMPVIIIGDDLYNDINQIFKSFGFKFFFSTSPRKNLFKNLNMFFKAIFETLKSFFFIKKVGFDNFIKKFYYKDILLGDLIYDSYVRFDKKFINPKIDLKLLRIIFLSCYKTLKMYEFFKNYRIQYLFIHQDCYVNNETIGTRIAYRKNIKVFKFNSSDRIFLTQAKKFEIKEGFLPINKYFSKKRFNSEFNFSSKKLSNFLKKRFVGKIKYSYSSARDLTNANKLAKYFTKKNFIEKIYKKKKFFDKIILFAPHAFADAPHYFGINFIFRDYYNQFVETIDYIDKNGSENILWLVRPHPSSKIYGEENIVRDYLDSKNSNIKFCDHNLINTKNLIDICDTVITGRGTIGLEFACYGKKPIIAGSSTYSNFGIAHQCKNKKEYFKLINSFSEIELSKNQVIFARKLLYYIETLYPLKTNNIDNNLIFNDKKKSITNLLNLKFDKNKPFFTDKFLKKLKKEGFEKQEIYKFFFKNAKFIN